MSGVRLPVFISSRSIVAICAWTGHFDSSHDENNDSSLIFAGIALTVSSLRSSVASIPRPTFAKEASMRKPGLIAGAFLAVAALASGLWSAAAQEASSTGVAVHVVVTVEPRHGSNVPVINREDVMVYQGHDRAKVTDWLPLQGEHAGLQLFILIDDPASSSLRSQLEDIRQFIDAQPSTTAIGVAYMRNGTADILQNPTNDHAPAPKPLPLPLPHATASRPPSSP